METIYGHSRSGITCIQGYVPRRHLVDEGGTGSYAVESTAVYDGAAHIFTAAN